MLALTDSAFESAYHGRDTLRALALDLQAKYELRNAVD